MSKCEFINDRASLFKIIEKRSLSIGALRVEYAVRFYLVAAESDLYAVVLVGNRAEEEY